MGCWIETCAITNLPIEEGNDVVLVPIDRRDNSRRADPSAPVGFPLYGTYDGYGTIEVYANDADQMEYHAQAIRLLNEEYGTLSNPVGHWGSAESVQQVLRDWQGERGEHNHSTLLFHRAAWDKALEAVSASADSFRLYASQYNTLREYTHGRLNDMWTAYQQITSGSERISELVYMRAEQELIMNHNAHWIPFFRPLLMPVFRESIVTHSNFWDELVGLMLMDEFLTLTRRSWAERPGKGSQDSELALLRVVADVSNAILATQEKEDAEILRDEAEELLREEG